MKPVFREELEFLTIPSEYEGKLWVHLRAFRYFDQEFKEVKLGRNIKNITFEPNLAKSHNEVAKFKYPHAKIADSISQINSVKDNYDRLIVFISGGKDSTVLEDIINKHTDINYELMFNNTSNETHFTYQYIKNNYASCIFINPSIGFFSWVEKNKYIPTRFNRACCDIFKEKQIGVYLNDEDNIGHLCGIRKDESSKRSNYEFIKKGKWNSRQIENWDLVLPILDFTDMDIWSYILNEKINFNKLYEFGYNRVGCTHCPYRQDFELKLNEIFLPKYSKRWEGILANIFIESNLWSIKNCTIKEFTGGAWRGGRVRDNPSQDVIDEFKEHNPDKDIDKYFGNKCMCGKIIKSDLVGLNQKYYGRNIDPSKYKCLKCMARELEVTQKSLKLKIKDFKDQGCTLF